MKLSPIAVPFLLFTLLMLLVLLFLLVSRISLAYKRINGVKLGCIFIKVPKRIKCVRKKEEEKAV